MLDGDKRLSVNFLMEYSKLFCCDLRYAIMMFGNRFEGGKKRMVKFEAGEKHRVMPVVGGMIHHIPAGPSRKKGRGRPAVKQETKQKVCLTILPSLYKDLQKIAFVQGKSVSGLISMLMEEYRSEHMADLKKYRSMRK